MIVHIMIVILIGDVNLGNSLHRLVLSEYSKNGKLLVEVPALVQTSRSTLKPFFKIQCILQGFFAKFHFQYRANLSKLINFYRSPPSPLPLPYSGPYFPLLGNSINSILDESIYLRNICFEKIKLRIFLATEKCQKCLTLLLRVVFVIS